MFDSGRGTMRMTLTQEFTEQNRDILIRFLRREYIRQLEHSLQGVAMHSVGLHGYRDDIRSSVQLVLHGSSLTREDPLPSYTSIVQAYDLAGQRLLILGEPGAGKTTLLLELACELLARAESDSALPIPVIFNLSGWANQKPPLESWLMNQLQLVYNIPSPLSQAWLKQDNWLLLFDGLDELEESLRPACIEAINAYRGEEYSIPLVVCSRCHEYQAQESRLALSHAVAVQPLQEGQVIEYFEQLGEPVAAIREAVRVMPRSGNCSPRLSCFMFLSLPIEVKPSSICLNWVHQKSNNGRSSIAVRDECWSSKPLASCSARSRYGVGLLG